jgi:hypothetical protein
LASFIILFSAQPDIRSDPNNMPKASLVFFI